MNYLKNFRRVLALTVVSVPVFTAQLLLAQDTARTVAPPPAQKPDSVIHHERSTPYTLTLRDGSVFKCRRFEMISDSILSVTLTNGEQVRFTKSEFVSITRSGDSDTTGGEGKAVAAATVTGGPAETPARSAPPSRHPGVAVFASLCPPLGDFAATDIESGGGATLGYGFGLELSLPIDDHNCWIISGAMQFYGFEMPGIPGVSMNNGSWRMILPMTGPRISLSLSEDASIFCEAMIGWDFQSSPEMNLGVPGFSLTLPSSSAGAIAYAIGGGVVFRDLVRLRVRFIDGGSPEYSISTSIALQSYMYTVKQPTKVIEISLGVIL